MVISPAPSPLLGRSRECETLRDLVARSRAADSQVLVVRGEAGIGKSALLQYLEEAATGFRVLRAAGVESDMDLAFAGLEQLCAPLYDRAGSLPGPQRDALSIAFGRSAGETPDRFLVGLAVLGLLAAAADDGPVLCVVDDAQWLDRVSVQTLSFVARRLLAEPIAMVFAQRESTPDWTGLPELVVGGLADSAARALLDSAVLGRIDDRVGDRIVAETRGNPLALLELPRGLSAAELAGGYHRPDVRPVAGQIEEHYLSRLRALPGSTQRLLLAAAAEPVGDVTVLMRAADQLGVRADLAAAEADDLIAIGAYLRFRHPLVRSAVYRAADPHERREVHRALAEATDPASDPDRRAWHRAYAAVAPDESVATDLVSSAARAEHRAGSAAAAAFLARAAELTPDPAIRGGRALDAAEAKRAAAAPDEAETLLAMAELSPLSDLERARLARLRAQLSFTRARGGGEAPLLLSSADELADTARQLASLDQKMANETHLDAISVAMYAGRFGGPDLVRTTAAAVPTDAPDGRTIDLMLRGLATRLLDGSAAALEPMRAAAAAIRPESWSWQAFPILHESLTHEIWDDEAWHRISSDAVRIATEAGALAVLPMALVSRAGVHIQAGEFASAAALIVEAEEITAATGTAPVKYHKLALAAWVGAEADASALIDVAVRNGAARGEGRVTGLTGYSSAVLYNGLGRYQVALAAARQACEYEDLGLFSWSLIELVEAAVRAGDRPVAAAAAEQLSERLAPSGTDWALGVLARSRALLTDGPAARELYLEAIERLERTRIAVHLARVRLLYGEWLRRDNRRADARTELRAAHEMFSRFGAEAFADRARRELLATGEKANKRPARLGDALTPQEQQIAELAGAGLTNTEIGAQLFISSHTVEWHLRKVFTKLAIRSRRELRDTPWR